MMCDMWGFLSTFLLSTTTKCFRLILYIFCSSPRISHYRKLVKGQFDLFNPGQALEVAKKEG